MRPASISFFNFAFLSTIHGKSLLPTCARATKKYPFPFAPGLLHPLSPTLPIGPTGQASSSESSSSSSVAESTPSSLEEEPDERGTTLPLLVLSLGGLTTRTGAGEKGMAEVDEVDTRAFRLGAARTGLGKGGR